MQVVQAGQHKLIQLELEGEILVNLARQVGFECTVEDTRRGMVMELRGPGRLLLFDASEAGNLGWFSRCQFYVDGQSGAVLQTPMTVGNVRDRNGRAQPDALRVQLAKELPLNFRLPGRNPVTEQSVYAVFLSFLNALLHSGVGVCGGPVVKPVAGRTPEPAPRS